MGALCGKESRDDNFAGPGRRLDSSPDQSPTAPLPSNKRVVGGSPRTLGGSSTAGAGGASAVHDADVRAKAAEARIKAAGTDGKLGRDLKQQQKQPLNKLVQKSAEDERQRKLIDANNEQLSYN